MVYDNLITYILPDYLKNDKLHEDYEEVHAIINGNLWSVILLAVSGDCKLNCVTS